MFLKKIVLSIVAVLHFIGAFSINLEGRVVVDGVVYSFYYNDAETHITEISPAYVASGDYSGTLSIPESINVSLYGETYSLDVYGFRSDALCNCKNLTSIIIPKSIKSIPSGLLSDCDNLTSVVIDDNNNVYDSRDNCIAVIKKENDELVSGCKNTKIPNGVRSIGNGAFKNCSGLSSITIPTSVISIGRDAFRECDYLTSVIIGDGVVSIDGFAFYNCSSLATITIGSSVANIGGFAFAECSKLADVISLNISVPPINYEAFYNSSDYLATLHVPFQALDAYKSTDPWSRFSKIVPVEGTQQMLVLTYKVDGEVYKTYEIEYDMEITPEPEPTKKGMTFSGWSEIPEKMPAHDVTVTGAFSWSKTIKDKVVYEVTDTLNNSCKVVGNDNASGEIKIDSVVIDGCYYRPMEIADKVFYGCKDITKIEIAKTVANIGERAFAKIDKLTDVTCWAEEVPAADRTMFENSYIEDYVTLHVPASVLEKYKVTASWKNFKEIVAIEGTMPMEKCSVPIIEYVGGKLTVNCDTEGAECVTTITSADFGVHHGREIDVCATYNISSYAKAEGYANSDVATATLCWIELEGSDTMVNESIESLAAMIQSLGGNIWVTGNLLGSIIKVYNVAGQLIGSERAVNGTTIISTNLKAGSVVLVEIGKKKVKVLVM